MTRSRRFEFINKQARNEFLRHNSLCIAGGLNSWPNVLNHACEFVGDAYQLPDGRHHVEIWAQFLDTVVELGTMKPANDVEVSAEGPRRNHGQG
ncbi:MAG: hypothetical protein CSA65_04280 [Proteobacteria bacterium]|nr:MAG: hypothetical protein CSB49_07630 [Pseudomonadota bacterium]PIE18662.1 MAG: hypothetical protein CSA65_04280 [Pseudomonadota bacterium]